MKKLLVALLLTATIGQANADDYCNSSAKLTKATFDLRLQGYKMSEIGSILTTSGSRYFASHAYSLPLSYTHDQAYESGYELCIAAKDSLIMMD